MKQHYVIVELASSPDGRRRRIQVPYRALYALLAVLFLGCFSLFGIVSSYLRMAWKVANYNTLRQEIEALRVKYQTLEKSAIQTNEQLATLQVLASEVSAAYGLKRRLEGPDDIIEEGRLVPTLHETLAEYDFLKSARISRHLRNTSVMINARPALWPIEGRLLSSFGMRQDPFSGMGGFHTGVDISAPVGTPVRATADGVVEYAGWQSGYGKLLVIQHPGGMETYYAHLSQFAVIPGQEVRLGEVVAYSGATGRATAPHLHYEVRDHGSPINPYKFLRNSAYSLSPPKKDFPF
ncbi:MAG: M23 family metallopeptidase [Bryobacteraceae bacterium]|nr:M23 family metallopeptidase [Bryobacteraceae bacterium]MDW8377672.1 M23 family metallopeptidase [Bryobacterales bacterium]